MNNKEATIWLIKNRPVDIGRAFGFKLLHPIDENGYSLHNEWIKMMLFSEEDILIQAHRESYKTTCVIVSLAINMIAFYNMNVAFLRKTDDDIKEVIKSVAKCLKTDVALGLAYNLYGVELILEKESSSELTTNLFVDSRGSAQLTGMGIGSSLTGKHYDKIYTDDIINKKDRTSKAERDEVKMSYGELVHILNDKKPDNKLIGTMCNTGTPWHRDDAYTLMPKPMIWTYHDTNILTEEKIKRAKEANSPSLFAANYELKHVSDEGMLFKGDPVYSNKQSSFLYGYAHVDAAFGGDNYTAFTIISPQKDEKGETEYYIYGKVWRMHVKKCYGFMKEASEKFRVNTIFIEDNADKGYVSEEMDSFGMWTKTYHEQQKKAVKISTVLYSAWKKLRWHPDTDPDYIIQIKDYIEGFEPDDAPDSAASLIRQIEIMSEAFIM